MNENALAQVTDGYYYETQSQEWYQAQMEFYFFNNIDYNGDGWLQSKELDMYYGSDYYMDAIEHAEEDHISWDEWWCWWGGYESTYCHPEQGDHHYYRQYFSAMDADHDGFVTREEHGDYWGYDTYGYENDYCMANIDENGDDMFDLDEYYNYWYGYYRVADVDEEELPYYAPDDNCYYADEWTACYMFKMDTNHDGVGSREEWAAYWNEPVDGANAVQKLNGIDADGDNYFDLEDYEAYWLGDEDEFPSDMRPCVGYDGAWTQCYWNAMDADHDGFVSRQEHGDYWGYGAYSDENNAEMARLDLDGDDMITREDYEYYGMSGYSCKEFSDPEDCFWRRMDVNQDGKVTRFEQADYLEYDPYSDEMNFFMDHMDADGDDEFYFDDWAAVYRGEHEEEETCPMPRAMCLFDQYDTNGDGKVSAEEFAIYNDYITEDDTDLYSIEYGMNSIGGNVDYFDFEDFLEYNLYDSPATYCSEYQADNLDDCNAFMAEHF